SCDGPATTIYKRSCWPEASSSADIPTRRWSTHVSPSVPSPIFRRRSRRRQVFARDVARDGRAVNTRVTFDAARNSHAANDAAHASLDPTVASAGILRSAGVAMSVRRWLGIAVLAVLVLVAVGIIALPGLVRQVAIARIHAITKRPVNIDRVELHLLRGRVT